VRIVWVTYPQRREIVVHRNDSAATLTETGTLEGGGVAPGFTLPVANVFGDWLRNRRSHPVGGVLACTRWWPKIHAEIARNDMISAAAW
jgi:hypothetical protein